MLNLGFGRDQWELEGKWLSRLKLYVAPRRSPVSQKDTDVLPPRLECAATAVRSPPHPSLLHAYLSPLRSARAHENLPQALSPFRRIQHSPLGRPLLRSPLRFRRWTRPPCVGSRAQGGKGSGAGAGAEGITQVEVGRGGVAAWSLGICAWRGLCGTL